jgi:hypothetical protein
MNKLFSDLATDCKGHAMKAPFEFCAIDKQRHIMAALFSEPNGISSITKSPGCPDELTDPIYTMVITADSKTAVAVHNKSWSFTHLPSK